MKLILFAKIKYRHNIKFTGKIFETTYHAWFLCDEIAKVFKTRF